MNTHSLLYNPSFFTTFGKDYEFGDGSYYMKLCCCLSHLSMPFHANCQAIVLYLILQSQFCNTHSISILYPNIPHSGCCILTPSTPTQFNHSHLKLCTTNYLHLVKELIWFSKTHIYNCIYLSSIIFFP